MPPIPWASSEQQVLLNAHRDAFIEAQKNKTVYKFWVTFNREWFDQWPEPGTERLNEIDITEEEKIELGQLIDERKKKIKHWFNNHANKTRKPKPIVLQVNAKAHRLPQPIELYSHQAYEAKIKAVVDKEMEEKNIPNKNRIALVKLRTQEAFDAEPEDVKGAILAEIQARKETTKEAKGPVTVKSMAETIECLPVLLDQVFEEFATRTGWSFSVIAGGPDPINGGRIGTFGYHRGTNGLGVSFGKAHPSFEETILKPFAQFLKDVYPSSICSARALHENSDNLDNSNPTELLDGVQVVPFTGEDGVEDDEDSRPDSGPPIETPDGDTISAPPALAAALTPHLPLDGAENNAASNPSQPALAVINPPAMQEKSPVPTPSQPLQPASRLPPDLQVTAPIVNHPLVTQEKSVPTHSQRPPPASLLPLGFQLPPEFTFSTGAREPDPQTAPTRTKAAKNHPKKVNKKSTVSKPKMAGVAGRKASGAARKKAEVAKAKVVEGIVDENAGANTRVAASETEVPVTQDHAGDNPGNPTQTERGQRVRKPAASKEVVSLTDKRQALEALANSTKRRKTKK